MLQRIIFWGVLIFLQAPAFVFAQTAASGGGSRGGRLETYLGAGNIGIATSSTALDVSLGVQLVPVARFNWLQIGGDVSYQKVSFRGGSTHSFLALFGATSNFGPSMGDAVFISLGAAYRSGASDSISGGVDPNGAGFYFMAGKRIPITGGFSLRPSLGVVSCGSTGMVFRPFAVSYLF